MARIIVLDTHPLGLASNDPRKPDAARCYKWILALDVAGAVIVAPEIADFEVRRELLRAGGTAGIRRLDRLLRGLLFAPINRATMRLAADYWAHVRRAGVPTAPDTSLDADCILAAQASLVTGLGDVMTIATKNPQHLTRFPGLVAGTWESIVPERGSATVILVEPQDMEDVFRRQPRKMRLCSAVQWDRQ